MCYLCRCQCGTVRSVLARSLKGRASTSCGCLRSQRMTDINKRIRTKHGHAGTPEYAAWCDMRSRCDCPKNKSYKDYGGRGIRVAEEWMCMNQGFLRFLEHAGLRPSPQYSLDRIQNEGHYEPGNVRWALKKIQLINRRRVARIDQFSDDELLEELSRRHLANAAFNIARRGIPIDGSSSGLSVSELRCIGDPQAETIGASYARQ